MQAFSYTVLVTAKDKKTRTVINLSQKHPHMLDDKHTNKDSIKIQTRKNTNSILIKIILVQKSAYHTSAMLMATLKIGKKEKIYRKTSYIMLLKFHI